MVQVNWGMNSWPSYEIARWLFYRGSFTMEVYVSSVRTRAFDGYKADGRCTGVAVKRGSTASQGIHVDGQPVFKITFS